MTIITGVSSPYITGASNIKKETAARAVKVSDELGIEIVH